MEFTLQILLRTEDIQYTINIFENSILFTKFNFIADKRIAELMLRHIESPGYDPEFRDIKFFNISNDRVTLRHRNEFQELLTEIYIDHRNNCKSLLAMLKKQLLDCMPYYEEFEKKKLVTEVNKLTLYYGNENTNNSNTNNSNTSNANTSEEPSCVLKKFPPIPRHHGPVSLIWTIKNKNIDRPILDVRDFDLKYNTDEVKFTIYLADECYPVKTTFLELMILYMSLETYRNYESKTFSLGKLLEYGGYTLTIITENGSPLTLTDDDFIIFRVSIMLFAESHMSRWDYTDLPRDV